MDKYLEHRFAELYNPLLNSATKMVQERMEAVDKAVGEWTKQLVATAVEQMSQFYQDFGESIRKMLDRAEVDAGKVAPLLSQANFWLSPSMDMHLLRNLKDVAETKEATIEHMTAVFVRYYEDDEWAELKEMVSSWGDNPYFANRMHIIDDALEAHIHGKHTLVIPALLSQVEGIASSVLETPAGSSTGLVKDAITERQGEFLRAASKDILIKFVTSPVGYGGVRKKESEYFTPERFPEWLKSKGVSETQSINRHGILHGVHVNYASKENSLRAFLLLDVFYGMRRDEWDKRLQIVSRSSKSEGGT